METQEHQEQLERKVPKDRQVHPDPQVKRDQRTSSVISSVMDTGLVLMDAATSPDRADEALSVLMPLVPGARYFRYGWLYVV